MKLVLGMELGISPADFVLDVDPVALPQKGAEPPPQFSAHFYCGQTARCIKMPLGMELGISPADFVLDGDPVALPQEGRSPLPNFRPFLLWPNARCINMPLGMDVGVSPGDFVLDGDPAPPPKRWAEHPPPKFAAHVYCCQTTG